MRGRIGVALAMLAVGCTAEPPTVAVADAPVFTPAPVASSRCAPVVRPSAGEGAAAMVGALVVASLAVAAHANVGSIGQQPASPRIAANGQRC